MFIASLDEFECGTMLGFEFRAGSGIHHNLHN